MEHLPILERICNNISDSLEPGKAMYIFAAAICDSWSDDKSTTLERNLVSKLIQTWKTELEQKMVEAYKKQENFQNEDEYYKKWLESHYKLYHDNHAVRRVIWLLWEDKYGLRISWPK